MFPNAIRGRGVGVCGLRLDYDTSSKDLVSHPTILRASYMASLSSEPFNKERRATGGRDVPK